MELENNKSILLKIICRKLAIFSVLAVSAIAAFATLGDGKVKSDNHNKSLLSNRTIISPRSFSLKSGYNFRGSQLVTFDDKRYINLNTVLTYERGSSTYVMPLKKKLLLDKITFNPNPATRN